MGQFFSSPVSLIHGKGTPVSSSRRTNISRRLFSRFLTLRIDNSSVPIQGHPLRKPDMVNTQHLFPGKPFSSLPTMDLFHQSDTRLTTCMRGHVSIYIFKSSYEQPSYRNTSVSGLPGIKTLAFTLFIFVHEQVLHHFQDVELRSIAALLCFHVP